MRLFFLLPLLPLLAACEETSCEFDCDGPNEPALALVCDSTPRTVSEDEALSLGFSVAEAMAMIEATTVHEAEMESGGTTEVSLTLTQANGPVIFIDQYNPYTGEESPDCPDYVSVPVDALVSSLDGGFDLDIEASLRVMAMDAFTLEVDVDLGENEGSFGVEEVAGEESSLRIEHQEVSGVSGGEISVITEGSGSDVAWVSRDLVMSWDSSKE